MSRQEPSESLSLVKTLFSQYYEKARLDLPSDMGRREFAFQYLGAQGYHRHLSFKDERSLRKHMVSRVPAHSYYSSAVFLLPEVPSMEEKGWLGSDLIFDIDADDLPGCSGREQNMICPKCGHSFRGAGRVACPKCGHMEPIAVETVDHQCLKKALSNLSKLARVLEDHLGIKVRKAYFSGGRGYHLHVQCDDRCRGMDGDDRREILDYLTGVGLDVERILGLGSGARLKKNILVPRPGEPGWRGRLGEALRARHGPLPDHLTMGQLEESLGGRIDWELYVDEARIHVDEKVTMDVHRLVRIPGSINGKTGMPVTPLEEGEWGEGSLPRCSWSPFYERPLIVKVKYDLPSVRVFDTTVKARAGQVLRLDGCSAVYLALKGLVEPRGEKR